MDDTDVIPMLGTSGGCNGRMDWTLTASMGGIRPDCQGKWRSEGIEA